MSIGTPGTYIKHGYFCLANPEFYSVECEDLPRVSIGLKRKNLPQIPMNNSLLEKNLMVERGTEPETFDEQSIIYISVAIGRNYY